MPALSLDDLFEVDLEKLRDSHLEIQFEIRALTRPCTLQFIVNEVRLTIQTN
jgi:hypothetical protein